MQRTEGAMNGWTAPRFAAAPLNVFVASGFLIAYLALERLSFLHEYQWLPVTPWNPGLGVMFALIVLVGAWGGALLLVGVVLAELFVLESRLGWATILAIAAIVAGGYTAAAHLARVRLKLDPSLEHLRDVLLLLAAGVVGAGAVAALLGGRLVLVGQFGPMDAAAALPPLFIGDVIGIAVTTPLVLRFAFPRRLALAAPPATLAAEAAVGAVIVAVILWVVVAGEGGGVKYFYLLFAPLVAAALRHGLDGACVTLAATQFGLVALMRFHNYDAGAFTELQILMLALTATGLVVGVVVSERRNADWRARTAETRLREREAEAAQAARLSLVSNMASSLAHEINQPMTAARALARSAQHLARAPDADLTRIEANLSDILAQIDHAGQVIRRTREFLRRGLPEVGAIDMAGMLKDALALVRADERAQGIRIDLDVADDTPAFQGDRVQLQQVVLNLVNNAIDSIAGARRSDGRIVIAGRRAADAAHVEIAVMDNGPGVDEEIVERLFRPLTTSKQEGLGLGLSICASIVEAHGGRIRLHENRPGATEFRVTLPVEPRR